MGRRAKPTPPEIARRLTAIKLMVAGIADALPTAAKELRRSACEGLDDLIDDITR